MPEGDTILRAAHQLTEALAGEQLIVSTPNPRGRAAGAGRLDGRVLERIDTHGKHLLLRFGDLVLHSHLGMSGSWRTYPLGADWGRSRNAAWVVLSGHHHEAAQFNGPTLRVLRRSQLALDPQISRLGPDLLAPDFDADQTVRAMRGSDPKRALGDALLDQWLVAGIGNIYKCESCFATGLSPWRPLGELTDEQLRSTLLSAREQMLAAVASGRAGFAVYGRRGRCGRCGGQIRHRGQGDANRTTWWCPSCQL